MKIRELIDQYNVVAKGAGLNEIKNWKGSREALQAKINALVSKTATRKGAAAKKSGGPKKSGPTVRSVAEAAIAAGKTNEEALAAVAKALPGAKTTIGCIRWYRAKLKSAE